MATLLFTGCGTPKSGGTAAAARGGGEAVVTFAAPEKFTDVELTDTSREASRASVLPQIEQIVQKAAARELTSGYRLEVQVTDVDMAGWMRPGRAGRRMRVVREGLPARIQFAYTLKNSSGETLRTGRETLSRMPSETVAIANVDPDTTILLDEMMQNWIRSVGRKL